MSDSPTHNDGLVLPGLDGSNPLAFLAALGTLRALSDAWPNRTVAMSWTRRDQFWQPRLNTPGYSPTSTDVISTLGSYLPYRSTIPDPKVIRARLRAVRGSRALERMETRWKKQKMNKEQKKQNKTAIQQKIENSRMQWLSATHPYLTVGKNTNLKSSEYRQILQEVAACDMNDRDRLLHDQYAALGSDLAAENGCMLDTALRTMSGSGHQHQLEFMANLLEHVKPKALHRALFETWDYGDPVRGLTLRLDPIDDSRYALQWENPSTDSTREKCGSMLGANALAILGFSCLPTVPAAGSLRTVGFKGTSSRDTFWTWPLWSYPISCSVTCALLSHPSLFQKNPDAETLHRIGVATIYSSQRLTVGKYRNFTPARAVMT